MGNYNNNSNYSGGFQDRRGSGDRGYDRPRHSSQNGRNQMHDAVCSDCGSSCQVPFMPSSGKPIYCSNCFEKRGNGRSDDSNDSRRPMSPRRPMSSSFSNPSAFSDSSPKNYDKQLKSINEKLDLILKILAPKEVAENEEVVEKIESNQDAS